MKPIEQELAELRALNVAEQTERYVSKSNQPWQRTTQPDWRLSRESLFNPTPPGHPADSANARE